ncbi:hypothetical protein COT44_02210 [Candidatus Shapirobacteria bacterium CG08_land_8_20_14_0_20_39_18]|uniref:Uncharacterized protein n=1 Tax=Candidatus Shapirobacteria bacterium CG08_land_8_20_14_0_20_39_18 TaxID=1974883 RepID=A0A2M6XD67_9BACT|nr:MAG: hypothetical protein COT44_02210 [Candidatus Shapirobacteria bacterium CG08_land_8_20_14_0_20_39_18]PIY66125.1 MAG: hypothetical protein COY91_01480 [Candidatus Shapirobacteria bacterium CG_4_10_14_0_8_um_filter_39_15]PJE68512.1 MAG: hypothetical protein COU94_01450 [Candidatus Shapirobacteria bacterium CG10_big_fil_rev_8_21_14_0_10_38_8]
MKNLKELVLKSKQLTTFLIGLIVILFSYKLVLPKLTTALEIYRQIGVERTRLAILKTKTIDLQNLNEKELQDNNNLALKAVPPQKNVINVISSLDNLANQNGVLIDNLTISSGGKESTVSTQGLNHYEFSLQVIAGIDQINTLMDKIKTSLPILTVKGLTVDNIQQQTDLNIQTYYLNFPQTIGAVDTPVQKLTKDEEDSLKKLASYTAISELNIGSETGGGKINPFSQ